MNGVGNESRPKIGYYGKPMKSLLGLPVQGISGIASKRAAVLEGAGICTLEDMLCYQPFRYEDRREFRALSRLVEGREVLLRGQIRAAGTFQTPRKRVRIFEAVVADDSGSLPLKFFNQGYLEKVLRRGSEIVLYGVARRDSYTGRLTMVNPEFELINADQDQGIHMGRIVPVYRRIGNLPTRALRQIMFRVLRTLSRGDVGDLLPAELLDKYRLPGRLEAFQQLHFPEVEGSGLAFVESLNEARSPAHQRFIFEEFFLFQLGLAELKRRRLVEPRPRSLEIKPKIRDVIKRILPFHPTAAQKRVLKEIVDDLTGERVMSRLLQGDVGSGKTIVALQAMVVALENGFQTALMAPTELLAEQHLRTFRERFEHVPYNIQFLSSRVKGKERRDVLDEVADGRAQIVIGTHALFQEDVQFADLGLVVIDEQHRFGVVQRSQLMHKGRKPDTLVMTATPIPRSLALTVYGELDLSVIDELPPGRKPIETRVCGEGQRSAVYQFLDREFEAGRQAYVVYPLVEESDKLQLKAATEMAALLQEKIFPERQVGLVHGRLKGEEKEELMRRFQSADLDLLVATTVIEVGIDVSNATVMLVEHADRFGLSQLHQLRGRIGRGSQRSVCILMVSDEITEEARLRLEIMAQTNDGFKIAERDLELRGPGEFVGTRQSGVPNFRFGNIVRDRRWLELAREEAQSWWKRQDPKSSDPALLSSVRSQWKRRFSLFEVG